MRNRLGAVIASVVALTTLWGPRPLHGQTAAPNYHLIDNWAKLPAGTQFGVMSAVATDANGTVYVFQREPSKIIVFGSDGNYMKSWGDGEFPAAHGLRILNDGVIWLTDRKLQQALKYSLDGKLLQSLGKKGVAGDDRSEDAFNGVSDVAMTSNGNLFVSDGEGGNSRVVKFSKQGSLIKFWGTKGSEPGLFDTPHSIAVDSKDRVYVADRGNKRIQVFDQEGKLLTQMTQFGPPGALFITKDDMLYCATSAAEGETPAINIGTVDGKVLTHLTGGLSGVHGIAVDNRGSIYVAEVAGKTLLKFGKQ
jgi:DNA-binding beta-propeller fold protein YncE